MTAARSRTGRLAEDFVAHRLAGDGWQIVERNARTRFGELDIVALEGSALVFVEVKAGYQSPATGPERPVIAVNARKQRRIRRLATAWMALHRNLPRYSEIRFDVVGVSLGRGGEVREVEHLRAAF
jgi:putative endonuclease